MQRGFTLIEILVVVVILALSLTIVAGFIPRGNTGLTLTTSAGQLVNMLRLAHAHAMATQRPVVFTVALDGHGFLLDRKVHRLPDTVLVSLPGAASIRFAPDGSSSGGIIRIQAGSLSKTVQVDWLTGRVAADTQ